MTWNLDPSHTQVEFSVRHMMISTVRGSFGTFSAEAKIDLDNIESSTVSATAQVATIQTGEEQRDGHLKSADFFDAEKFPELKLTSTKVEKSGDTVVVEAQLTIKDVTKSVQLKGEVLGPAKDPWGNQRVGFSLQGEINREDFGLTWNQALETGGVLVGKKVTLSINAQFVAA